MILFLNILKILETTSEKICNFSVNVSQSLWGQKITSDGLPIVFFPPAVMSLTALTDRPISIVPTAKLDRLSKQSIVSANDAVGHCRSSELSRNGISEN